MKVSKHPMGINPQTGKPINFIQTDIHINMTFRFFFNPKSWIIWRLVWGGPASSYGLKLGPIGIWADILREGYFEEVKENKWEANTHK